MNKRFTKLIAAFALLVFMTPSLAGWGQTRTELTYDFSEIEGFSEWTTSYSEHVVVYEDATVTFASANRQTNTITDIPVTKGQPVSLVLNDVTNQITSATFVCRQWGSKTQTITLHYSTNGGQDYTSTGVTSSNFTISSDNLPEGTNAVKITFSSTANQVGIVSATINIESSSSTAVATQVTIDATGITNTDVYTSTEAGSLSATVSANGETISGALVAWSSSNTDVATINENGEVTLVAAGTTTITAAYGGESGVYNPSSATYELAVTSSAPYVQPTTIEIIPNYTFWGEDAQFSGDAFDELSGSKDNVSLDWTRGSGSMYANQNAMRFYKDNTLTFTAPEGYEIKSIVLTVSGTYSDLTFAPTGFDNETTTWTGSSETVTMSRPSNASSYATISKFTITIGLPSTDPSITASNVSIEYDATEGEIAYTVENPVDGATVVATTTAEWLTIGTIGETVPFTCSVNTETSARTATVTLNYVKNGETLATKDVTVTQAAAPVVYTTIPALFEAATSTEKSVLVTFNNWVVSGSTNKNVFVTDNNGNGFVIFDNDGGLTDIYTAGDILSGTAVSCTLKKYNGFAELLNVNATDLSIATGGNVTEANVAMADLAGVNTGALVHYDNLICSIDNNKYYLSDGTTTIQIYNTLYSFTELEDGKTYNITGIYQQFNSTKEILPRSAEDIEEVVVTEPSITVSPSEITVNAEYHQDVLTVTYENLDPTSSNPVAIFYDAEGHETNCSWLWVELQSDRNFRYTIFANEGEARTAYFKIRCNGVYSEMVTVSQAAYVIPFEGGTYTLATSIEEGRIYIIVGKDGEDAYAMGDQNNNNRGAVGISIDDNTATVEEGIEAYEFYIESLGEGSLYCIYDFRKEGFLYAASSSSNYLRTEDALDNNGKWNITFNQDGVASIVAQGDYTRNVMQYNSVSTLFSCYASASQKPVYLYVKEEETPESETYELTINGYTDAESKAGYYLIASPVTVNIADVAGLTEGDFDLYSYDESQELEWINYKQEDGSHPFTTLEPGKGYLYAKKATAETPTYTFTLTGTPYDGTPIVLSKQSTGTLAGWNLIGNPSATSNIAPGHAFYIMNSTIGELIASESSTVEPKQGFFVIATEDGEEFEWTAPLDGNLGKVVMNLSRNRGNVIDRAIVRFDEGDQLPKFQLNPNNTKIYFAQADNDYAVVRSANEGEMPVSFRAAENGTYTLSFSAENTEMRYMHLIDNMTGNDIDLLQTPSYTFEAKTSDYASRFRLVFNANNGVDEMDEDQFAYFNGSEWMVSNLGEATLQVVDVMGRVLSTETISGNAELSLNQPAGVYMLRLINGNDVKVQKVVVR